MCKIFTFTNSKQLNVTQVTNTVGKALMAIEQDGFGYAVQGKDGVYGEKCIDNTFNARIRKPSQNPQDAIVLRYESFGKYSKPVGPMICHGRTSTNDAGLENCHPMIKDDHYLIHNGVVTDEGPKYAKATTNDSEDLLHRFTEGIQSVEKHLTGYYAFTCITPDGKLHVVKDRTAELCMTWCESLNTFIIATKAGLIRQIAKALKVKIGPIDTLKDDIHLVFDGNKLDSCNDIESRGFGYRESQYASASLGKTLDSVRHYDYGPTSTYDLSDDDTAYDLARQSEDLSDSSEFTQFELDSMLAKVDDSCTIYFGNTQLAAAEFHQLGDVEKANCEVMLDDGSYLDLWKRQA